MYSHSSSHRKFHIHYNISSFLQYRIHNFHIFQKYKIDADRRTNISFHVTRIDLSDAGDDCRRDRTICIGQSKVIQLEEDRGSLRDIHRRDCQARRDMDDQFDKLWLQDFHLHMVARAHEV